MTGSVITTDLGILQPNQTLLIILEADLWNTQQMNRMMKMVMGVISVGGEYLGPSVKSSMQDVSRDNKST